MGMFGFIVSRVIPSFILFLAIIIGWLSSHDSPEGIFFATLGPLSQGILPPTLIGHGYMKGVPEVPSDMVPLSRPKDEMFLSLPGNEKMPQNGIGMCCRPTAYDNELVRRTILWYLLSGGRHIDTAHLYLNHKAIGEGIKMAIARGVPRKEIFVTTKVDARNFGPNATRNVVNLALEDMDLEYIDLVLMHMPSWIYMTGECKTMKLTTSDCREETWKTLSKIRNEGLVKNVGVSNFNIRQLKEIQALKLAPIASHQMEYNLWAPDHTVEVFEYCQQNKIAVTAYSSLGGIFQNAKTKTIDKLNEIANAHDKSVFQIMLRWALQKNAAVIPGTGNPKHMVENLDVYKFKLSKEEMSQLDALRSDEKMKEFYYFLGPDSLD